MSSPAPTQFGRYELLTEIGRGGMAALHLARLRGHGGFEKYFAIKRILPHLTQDTRFVEMFLNEGKIAARLMHPNVCQVFELGDVDGELFLAMEYLEGVALDELAAALPDDPVLRLRLAAAVLGQACEGLHYAHSLRDPSGNPTPVVHRDISPHNLFVTTEGSCKLLDFGVSKVLTGADSTRSGLIKGKLTYMPPEQIRGEEVDARVDIFAMGVVLWELLAGRRLFLRDSDYMIMQAIMEAPIPPLAPPYAGGVDAVIARTLQRDRTRRPQFIRTLADALGVLTAPYGGPFRPAEVAAIVRRCCATKLADRSRVFAEATDAVRTSVLADMLVPEPSVTASISLRGGSVSLAPRTRRRWLVPVVVGGVAIAAVSIVLATRPSVSASPEVVPDDAALVTMVVSPDAALADAALPDAAVPEPDAAVELVEDAPPPKKRKVATAPKGSGYFSIDAQPYATIYVDGKRVDQTPLFKLALPSGTHKVRAVRADGRAKTFTIRVAPGQHVNSGTLRW